MTGKYSVPKCEQYGQRLAARLCDQHFGATPNATLDGPAVLNFTPVRQINLLVVRQLLHKWQTEISRLRSPYFNFEAPAVQAALIQFQNTLSRYIQLSRASFEPLLACAITDTLLLAADPASAFERLLLAAESAPTTANLREGLRYIEFTKDFYSSFLDSLPATDSLSSSTVVSQLRTYQQANYQPTQPIQHLIAALRPLLPLTEADLQEDNFIPVTPNVPPTPVTTSASEAAPTSFSISTTASSPATIEPSSSPGTSQASGQPPLTESRTAQTPTDIPLHEKLKATQPSVMPLAAALRAAQAQPTPLAERQAPKVETLREAISINQRFSFINELFNGENMEYHAAIQHLDSLSDYEQARLYIAQNLAQRYGWSRKEEHVTKLLKLVERKYAPA